MNDNTRTTPLSATVVPDAEGPDHLVARLAPDRLGFRPERIWNPSPSRLHRTSPWPLPKTLVIGIHGNPDTGAKYSPPPFAVGLAGKGRWCLVSVVADPGWHLWNEVIFAADESGVTVRIDLEGRSDPGAVAAHVKVVALPSKPDETPMALLARGLRLHYPAACDPAPPAPDWWLRPSYCGWGDQVTLSMWLEGVGHEGRAGVYNTQGLYERWIRRLERAKLPVGTVTVDAGWSPTGTLKPRRGGWPDLKAFTRRQHEAGRKVLLWLGAWLAEGLPDAWCVTNGVVRIVDPTHPEYRRYLRDQVRELLAPDGFDADGFKIDQLAYCPSVRHPRGEESPETGSAGARPIHLAGPGWGCELMHQLQRDIFAAAKAAKPDCLITSSTVHPYFHDTFDMVRLHDMGHVAEDIFAAMGARADLARAALPSKLVDTDDWIHTDYDLWLRYTSGSGRLGVPCIFYAERFMQNWSAEPATRLIPLRDLRRIGAAWRRG